MDYIAASGDTTFSSKSGQQCVDIKIVDDNVSESLETFSLNIDTSVNSVVLEPNFTVVEIQDNDGESESDEGIKGQRGRARVRWRVRGRGKGSGRGRGRG